jgi:autotransporter-associated beta strand protein
MCRRVLGLAFGGVALMSPLVSHSQMAYNGGILNSNQTYDGLGADSASNPLTLGSAESTTYALIGNGTNGVGSLTVLSGTLTFNADDFKVANAPSTVGTGVVLPTGSLYLGAGATLNVNMNGRWGAGVGQYGAGTVALSNSSVFNVYLGGSSEQRLVIGNGAGAVGTVHFFGGVLNISNNASLTDDQQQVRIGADVGKGLLNLNSGSLNDYTSLPLVLGAKYTGMTGTPVLTQNTNTSVISIANGSLVKTGLSAILDSSKAAVAIGTNSFVSFMPNGSGYLSLTNWAQSDYEGLVTAGQIRVNSNITTLASFNFTSVGGQGILRLADPIASVPTVAPSNSAYAGEVVILSENAYGTAPFTYQWQSDDGTGGVSFSDIAGAASASYTNKTDGLSAGTYQYRVVVTNGLGNAITSAVANLTVQSATAPFITADTTPASAISRYAGGSATFSAAFDGNHPISYQWQLDGGAGYTNVPGGTNAVLALLNLQYANGGSYRLEASNSVGVTVSTPTALTVLNPAGLQFSWSAPVGFAGQTADQMLTNTLGGAKGVVGAEVFGYSAPIVVNLAGGRSITFKNDGSIATVTSIGTNAGAFPGSTTLSTSNASFDSVLNQFQFDGGPQLITLNNLVVGERYSVQIFAIDDRSGSSNRLSYFQDGDDPAISVETSATNAMGDNVYVVGTFTASNTTETILHELPTGTYGNLNALVLRAMSYVPSNAPVVLTAPASKAVFTGRSAQFSVLVDSYVTPTYQWQINGANLSEGGNYTGVATGTLFVRNVAGLDGAQVSCVVSNPAGTAASSAATLTVLAIPPGSGAGETAVLARGPVAYWPLNETFDPYNGGNGGMPVYDAASTNDGTYRLYAGNAYYSYYGPQAVDGFAQFAANQGALDVTTSLDSWVTTPALNLNTNTATISMWVYPTQSEPGFAGLLMNRNTGSKGGLHLRNSNELGYTWVTDDSTQWGHSTGIYVPSNMWSFVALVITPTNTSWYMYNTNGAQTHVYAISNPVMPWNGFETNIAIGKDTGNAARVFNGNIDEVAVFNRSLSQNEVFSMADAVNPVFVQQPQSQSVGVVSPAQFSASVASMTGVTYQWKTNGVNVSNGGVFSGATSNVLSLSSVAALNGVVFSLAATNATGWALSADATLTVVTPTGFNQYWDIDGATAGAGSAAPAGVWDVASFNWTTDSTGGSAGILWTNGNNAIFSAGTNATNLFVVTVTNSGVGLNNLTQTTGRIRLATGAITMLNTNCVVTVNTRGSGTASGDYDVRFDSDITGVGTLVKRGPGILHLLGNKTFSGGIQLNEGTLAFEPASDGQTVGLGSGPITLNGGALVKNWNSVTVTNSLNVMSNVNVAAVYTSQSKNWYLTGNWLPGSTSGNFIVTNASINGIAAQNMTLFVTGDISAYTGAITHNCLSSGGNRLRFGNATGSVTIDGRKVRFVTVGGNGGNGVDIADGSYGTFKMGELSGTGGKISAGWSTGGNTTFEVGALNTSTTYGGSIRDNINGTGGRANFTKVGAGTLALSGANTYTGVTTVSNGTLSITTPSLSSGTNVVIAAGGKLGLSFSGANSVKGLIIAGTAMPNGTYGASGSGAANIDDVHFTGAGKLKVTGSAPALPGKLVSSVNGSVLSISWPADQGWTLQVQTNAASVGLSSNWTTLVSGSAGISSTNIPVDTTKGAVFYRLVYP